MARTAQARQVGIHVGEIRVDQQEVAEFLAQRAHVRVEERAQLGAQHVAARIAGHVNRQPARQMRIACQQLPVLLAPGDRRETYGSVSGDSRSV